MNALIALCHFCEVHGPAVVICTQPYNNKIANSQTHFQVVDKSTKDEVKNYIHNNKLFNLYEVANQNKSPVTTGVSTTTKRQVCPSCTSIGKDGLPLISNDHSNMTTYMSSQSPEDNGLFTLLRHACIRSLTCEITPGEDGAIYFGEETNAHVLSYRFKLQNAQARGLRSTFSIVVLSKDKLAILNLWPFLVPNLKTIVLRLQEFAHAVFTDEQHQASNYHQTSSISTGITSTNSSGIISGSTNPELHPAISHRNRPGDKEQRNLIAITQQENIFQQLHTWFTWLLRVGGTTYKDWHSTISDPGEESNRNIQDLVISDTTELENQIGDLIELYLILGRQQFSILAFHTVVGNQIIVRADNERISTAIIQALSVLLPKRCAKLGYDRTTYRPLFQYNLLALDVSVPLSHEVTDVDADPCVVLLVTVLDNVEGDPRLSSNEITIRMDSSKPPIAINLTSTISVPCSPKIVRQYTDFLDNHELVSHKRMLLNLEIVLNDWLHNTELYFVYKKRQNANRLSDSEYENRLNQFLHAIGVMNNADHAVLRFWVQAMTDEYRRNILNQAHYNTNKPGLINNSSSTNLSNVGSSNGGGGSNSNINNL